MTPNGARSWLILSSLSITGIVFVFFLLAPALGFPLEFSQCLRIIEVILPVFMGYLGSAASFVFRSRSDADDVTFRESTSSLIGVLMIGPIVVFAISISAAVLAFGITNRSDSPAGSGITVDQLAAGISVILGLLAVTTNVAVSYLFGGGGNASNQSSRSKPGDNDTL